MGGGLRAEEAGIVWSKDGFKIAVVWDCGIETELDAEWVFDKVTGVPPMARYGATRLQRTLLLSGLAISASGCLLHGYLLHSFHVWPPAFGASVVACGVLNTLSAARGSKSTRPKI